MIIIHASREVRIAYRSQSLDESPAKESSSAWGEGHVGRGSGRWSGLHSWCSLSKIDVVTRPRLATRARLKELFLDVVTPDESSTSLLYPDGGVTSGIPSRSRSTIAARPPSEVSL